MDRSRNLYASLDCKWIWKSKAPAKIQFLIWLIVHDALSMNDTRARRGLASSHNCTRCANGPESTLHCLRDCHHTREVWLRLGLCQKPSFLQQSNVYIWIKENLASNSHCLFLVGLWWLWCWRNNGFFDDKWDIHSVVRNIFLSLDAFERYLKLGIRYETMDPVCFTWTSPPTSFAKLNVDGSFLPNSSVMGSGGIIRDTNGDWVVGFSCFEGNGNVLMAKLLAVKRGLLLAWDERLRQIIYETDSAEVIHMLHVEWISNFHSFSQVIMEIDDLLKRSWVVELRQVSTMPTIVQILLPRPVLRSARGSSIGRMPLLSLDRH